MEAFPPQVSVKDLASKYEHFLLDCDGVIWSGTQVLPGAIEAVKYL